MRSRFLVVCASVGVACARGGAGAAPPTIEVPASSAAASAPTATAKSMVAVAWIGGKKPRSVGARLSSGELGPAFTLDQRVVGDGRRLYRIEKEVVSGPARPCEGSGTNLPAEVDWPNTASLPILVDVLSGARTRLVSVPEDVGRTPDFQLEAEPYAQVGSWLFIQISTYRFDCGAHGGSLAELLVWDLARGALSKGFDQAGLAALGTPALSRAVAALNSKLGADGPIDGAGATVSAPVPAYDASGRLTLKLLFTAFACYACGDNRWGSYSISELVELDALPAGFAPHAAPAPLAALARQVPNFAADGYFERPDDASTRAAFVKLGARPLPRAREGGAN